jgi:hypothetical protein
MLVKVKDSTFVRDTESMGLINTNLSEKNEYYARVKLIKSQKDEINTVKSEMDNVKSEMQEIKNLLIQLLEKGSNG